MVTLFQFVSNGEKLKEKKNNKFVSITAESYGGQALKKVFDVT